MYDKYTLYFIDSSKRALVYKNYKICVFNSNIELDYFLSFTEFKSTISK